MGYDGLAIFTKGKDLAPKTAKINKVLNTFHPWLTENNIKLVPKKVKPSYLEKVTLEPFHQTL